MKPKVLFVDDEPHILDSLRLSLRPLRGAWDMSFAVGGPEGLGVLAKTQHDIVVSDMRMPGMDGAQFLEEVRRRYPETIRLILSGYADGETEFKTVKLAHRYLSKPCRPVDIIQAISQSLRLRDVLTDSSIKTIITNLDSLPVLNPIYNQLVSVLQNENTTRKEVGDIITQDMAICASILRLVNSAFFGMPERISSIHHAVEILGSKTLKVLVLSTSLFATFNSKEMPDFSVKMLWEHSLRVACFSKAIGENEGMKQEELYDCFIAGILHDIGKLILATKMRQKFSTVLARVRNEDRAIYMVEQEVLGATHAKVGAYLMSLWGFNDLSMDAVCWHHSPEKLSTEYFTPLTAVMLANSFDHELVSLHKGYVPHLLGGGSSLHVWLRERIDALREICINKINEGILYI